MREMKQEGRRGRNGSKVIARKGGERKRGKSNQENQDTLANYLVR